MGAFHPAQEWKMICTDAGARWAALPCRGGFPEDNSLALLLTKCRASGECPTPLDSGSPPGSLLSLVF